MRTNGTVHGVWAHLESSKSYLSVIPRLASMEDIIPPASLAHLFILGP